MSNYYEGSENMYQQNQFGGQLLRFRHVEVVACLLFRTGDLSMA